MKKEIDTADFKLSENQPNQQHLHFLYLVVLQLLLFVLLLGTCHHLMLSFATFFESLFIFSGFWLMLL